MSVSRVPCCPRRFGELRLEDASSTTSQQMVIMSHDTKSTARTTDVINAAVRVHTIRLGDRVAALEELRADGAGVVRLDRQDARCVAQIGLALDQGRGAVVGRHADVLEDERSVQEEQVVLQSHGTRSTCSADTPPLLH